MSAAASGSSRWSAERLAWVAICLAACLPYLRTVPDYFVQDDFGVVQLLAGKPWSTFPRWFAMPWMEDIWGYTPDEIRPFPALSYQITALWGAAAPEGHHLLNIALHAANGLLILAIARSAAGLTTAGTAVAAVAFVLLPSGAESVAWITGRVDSMPALFYLASFLAYVRWRQRRSDSNRLYVWSLIWFFFALFSKQNTITMVATLAAYDLLLVRRPVRPSWTWLRPYVPFAIMTLAFLALRYVVLGEILRESQLSTLRFADAGGMIGRHLQRIVFGDVGAVSTAVLICAGVYALVAVVLWARSDVPTRGRAMRAAVFFGPIWLALGLAPAIAAGYESPRHAYLAAVGWAMVIGIAFDVLRRTGRATGTDEPSPGTLTTPAENGRRSTSFGPGGTTAWAHVVAVATASILIAYGARLHTIIADWTRRAEVSEVAAVELERQVSIATRGTLVLVGVPVSSWEWAAPFVARPPFTRIDLTRHAFIVTPEQLHCCRGRHWENATRDALRAWMRDPMAPILAMHVSPSGEIRRLTGAEDADLAMLVRILPEIESRENLDGAIQDILRKLVAGRGRVISR